MRARGERREDGRYPRQLDAVTTAEAAEGMGMSEQAYYRRHAIGRGITPETAEVLDNMPTFRRILRNGEKAPNLRVAAQIGGAPDTLCDGRIARETSLSPTLSGYRGSPITESIERAGAPGEGGSKGCGNGRGQACLRRMVWRA